MTRNSYKQAHVIKNRGALGTALTNAPVLLFELYLAINNSSTGHSSREELPAPRATSHDSHSGSILPSRRVMTRRMEVSSLLEE